MKAVSKRIIRLVLLLGVSILLATGSCSIDNSVNPPSEDPSEGDGVQIGNEGGTVTLGDASVTVPAGYLPESLPFKLTGKNSFAQDVEYTLDPSAYQPMGAAYQFDTPLRSSVPLTLTISYDDQDIPQGFDAANLGVVQRFTGYPERLGGNERSPRQPVVRYLPLSTVVSPESGTVTFELFGRGTYQLMAMSEPIETFPFTVGGAQADKVSAAEELKFMISHVKKPVMDAATFNTYVIEAIGAAYAQ